ncbi:type III polyketide synthase [Cohnella lubricantis]|uniref:type III polyketide synthase n=1 Tax=Cohnella lubricantis TaxID=2163172 RepID=UPI001FD99C72|nr:type III polyketide synthase [Cohnella lubricantis]MBP2119020.1 putative naringenin-chalcone synthase [Cohnella lubricantis]
MPIAITGIGTAVPAFRLNQRDVWSRLAEALSGDPQLARWGKRIFAGCGVDSRYTCEPNLLEPAGRCRYLSAESGGAFPTTEERMQTYRTESVPLAAEAAKKALADSGLRPGEISHLLAVSCTGMFLPGLDAELARRLGLRADAERLPLTFLGCAAGLTAVREAARIVRGDPQARVLVVTVELCTLHIQPTITKEDLYTASFFGDGASACVVGLTDVPRSGTFALESALAVPFPETADKMVWTVGNLGFQLVLSPLIPRIIAGYVPTALQSFWGEGKDPELWAIHPGGKGIIDALEDSFKLAGEQTAASRGVLRDYGNMSSATILFVLEEMRRRQRERSNDAAAGGAADGIAVAFGPGIAAEFLKFAYIA